MELYNNHLSAEGEETELIVTYLLTLPRLFMLKTAVCQAGTNYVLPACANLHWKALWNSLTDTDCRITSIKRPRNRLQGQRETRLGSSSVPLCGGVLALPLGLWDTDTDGATNTHRWFHRPLRPLEGSKRRPHSYSDVESRDGTEVL